MTHVENQVKERKGQPQIDEDKLQIIEKLNAANFSNVIKTESVF